MRRWRGAAGRGRPRRDSAFAARAASPSRPARNPSRIGRMFDGYSLIKAYYSVQRRGAGVLGVAAAREVMWVFHRSGRGPTLAFAAPLGADRGVGGTRTRSGLRAP